MIEDIMDLYPDDKFLKADGFDAAILGVDTSSDPMRLIYSVKKCLEILEQEMEPMEALEYFEYNTRAAYVGPQTPIWCDDNF